MRTAEEITGLEKPILEDYMADQKNHPEDDMYDAYVSNIEAYAYNLERFIEREEEKKKGNLSIINDDLREIARLNSDAIDLNCDIYLMLEQTLGANFYEDYQSIYDALHQQWYDTLHNQERMLMTLQNIVYKQLIGKEED